MLTGRDPKELDRLEIIGRGVERRLTQRKAAEQRGLSLRQVERLWRFNHWLRQQRVQRQRRDRKRRDRTPTVPVYTGDQEAS